MAVLTLGYTSMFLSALYPGIFHTALSQSMESNICHSVYLDVTNSIDDPRCKSTEVQAELSLVLSLETTFGLMPTLLSTMPYGVAADIYGRKPIVMLSSLGSILYNMAAMFICRFPALLPPRMLWAVPLASIVGGGSAVGLTILYAMANDVVSVPQRSMTFLLLTTSRLVAVLISGPITYATLPRGVWLTFAVSMAVQLLGLLTTIALPETLTGTTQRSESAGHAKSAQSVISAIRLKVGGLVQQSLVSFTTLARANRKLRLLLAELIISVRSFVMLGIFLCVLPLANQLSLRVGIPPIRHDAWIARISIALVMVSSWMAGWARTVPIFVVAMVLSAFSLCLEPAMRSLILYSAKETGTGMLFSVMELLQALGFIASGPIVASSFRLGLRWGEKWLGLPLFIAACMAMPGALIIFLVRIEDGTNCGSDARHAAVANVGENMDENE
ncbi:hypothetical protein MY4824_004889 [Beauveria thailandica]